MREGSEGGREGREGGEWSWDGVSLVLELKMGRDE